MAKTAKLTFKVFEVHRAELTDEQYEVFRKLTKEKKKDYILDSEVCDTTYEGIERKSDYRVVIE